jgi:hypothetical protein
VGRCFNVLFGLINAVTTWGTRLGATKGGAAKLREGVSIYYNLSSRGRAAWNGKNTGKLPRETQLHIQNARLGAQQADLLDTRLRVRYEAFDRQAMLTAGLAADTPLSP